MLYDSPRLLHYKAFIIIILTYNYCYYCHVLTSEECKTTDLLHELVSADS